MGKCQSELHEVNKVKRSGHFSISAETKIAVHQLRKDLRPNNCGQGERVFECGWWNEIWLWKIQRFCIWLLTFKRKNGKDFHIITNMKFVRSGNLILRGCNKDYLGSSKKLGPNTFWTMVAPKCGRWKAFDGAALWILFSTSLAVHRSWLFVNV